MMYCLHVQIHLVRVNGSTCPFKRNSFEKLTNSSIVDFHPSPFSPFVHLHLVASSISILLLLQDVVLATSEEDDDEDTQEQENSEDEDSVVVQETPVRRSRSNKSTTSVAKKNKVPRKQDLAPRTKSAHKVSKSSKSSSKQALQDCSNQNNFSVHREARIALQDRRIDSDHDEIMRTRRSKKNEDEGNDADEKAELLALKAEIEQRERDVKKRELEVACMGPNSKKSRRFVKNEEVVAQIKEWIRNEGWRRNKFITCDRQTQLMMEAFFVDLNMFQGPDKKHNTRMKEQFFEDYEREWNAQLNDARQYVQSRIKKVAWEYMEREGGNLPQVGTIFACIERKLDLNDPEKAKIAVWWGDEVLPKATCNATAYDDTVRHHEIISKCTINEVDWDNPPPKISWIVPPGTEAFTGTLFKSCRKRWMNQYKWAQDHPGFGMNLVWKQGKTEDEVKAIVAVTNDILSKKPVKAPKKGKPKVKVIIEPDFEAEFTQPIVGQQKHGGWTDAGILKFKDLTKANKDARGTPEAIAWEEKLLELIRAEYDPIVLNAAHAAPPAADNAAPAQNAAQALEEIELEMED
jgi:hypothetical protein